MGNKKTGIPRVHFFSAGNLWKRLHPKKHFFSAGFFAWQKKVRGQFFSPDLIIALIIFIVIMAFFSVSSHAVAVQIDLYYTKNSLEEISHTVLNPLVSFSGNPFNWELNSFEDLNFVGLAKEKNILDPVKVDKFVSFLDNNYDAMRLKMGLGKYDFKFELQDFNGSIIKQGGTISQDFISRIVQKRIASYENKQVIVRGIISYAQ